MSVCLAWWTGSASRTSVNAIIFSLMPHSKGAYVPRVGSYSTCMRVDWRETCVCICSMYSSALATAAGALLVQNGTATNHFEGEAH